METITVHKSAYHLQISQTEIVIKAGLLYSVTVIPPIPYTINKLRSFVIKPNQSVDFLLNVADKNWVTVGDFSTEGLSKETTQILVKADLNTKLQAVADKLVDFNADSNLRLDTVAGRVEAARLDTNTRLDLVAETLAAQKATLCVTATGVSGAAVTATLPAVVGKFHNITYIEIVAYAAANNTASATPIIVTTTNLAGALPGFLFQTKAVKGELTRLQIQPAMQIRSTVANTTTTIVCPATTDIIWRVNVFYTILA